MKNLEKSQQILISEDSGKQKDKNEPLGRKYFIFKTFSSLFIFLLWGHTFIHLFTSLLSLHHTILIS